MSDNMWGSSETEFFYQLSPDAVLNAIESLGAQTTGRCLQLNSMENRVYEIELDTPFNHNEHELNHFVAKFYRPGRWTKEQILEEHQFVHDLANNEIPVIAPLMFDGTSLLFDEKTNLYFCLYPRKRGRIPGELNDEQHQQIGRLLARIHNIGATRKTNHRLHLDVKTYGESNLKYLLQCEHVPKESLNHLETIANDVLKQASPLFEGIRTQRVHGDCHLGNLIWREEEGFSFVDFDDMVVGPSVQDMWLLLPAEGDESIQKRNQLLIGYELFREFDYRETLIIEALRALRYIHYTTWIARRYSDPAFQYAFPHFKEQVYWNTLMQDLRVQQYKLQGLGRQEYW